MYRLDVKKRLFVMKKESLYPGERTDSIAKGLTPPQTIIFEGILTYE